jgi:hypothetical protein
MDRVAKLLAQFPGPLVLRPSKSKWFVLLVATALLTIGLIGQSVSSSTPNISDWIGVAFLSLCTLGFAYMILLANFEMILGENGFSWRGGRLSEQWQWTEVADFAVVEYAAGVPGSSLRKRIGFNDSRHDQTMSQRLGAGISEAMTGRDRFLPDPYGSSSFGLPMEELARLMSQWQERAMTLHRATN